MMSPQQFICVAPNAAAQTHPLSVSRNKCDSAMPGAGSKLTVPLSTHTVVQSSESLHLLGVVAGQAVLDALAHGLVRAALLRRVLRR